MKKKTLLIVSSLIVAVALCACGSPSPTETTDSFLQALKSEDSDAVKTLYADDKINILEEFEENNTGDVESKAIAKLIEEEVKPKMLDFKYEISNEKIDGNKATVDVKLTTYDMGAAFTAFAGEYFTQAFTLAFSGTSEEELNALAETLLSEKLTAAEKNYHQTVTVSLTQKDDKWMIDKFEENGVFFNAITGGIIDAVNGLNEAYNFDQ